MGTADNLAVAQLRQGGGRQPRHGRVESGLQSVVVSRPAQMVSGHAQLAGEKWASRRMCGIYGMVGADAEAVLPRMSAALVHRGPDGDGRAVRGAGGVGCRRLAIIDVAGGAQPLANETGDVIVVCNGEIYNHAALRAALESRGHRFRTHSDAEVLPHLYEERGIDFVHALDGMFGLALWDARRGRLVLARDRIGEQPLYHATTPARFLFVSEPNALLPSPRLARDPHCAALAPHPHPRHVPHPARP